MAKKTKVFIDTNIFLHCYDNNNFDKIEVIENDLKKYVDNLVLPIQSYDEFIRNRNVVLNGYLTTLKNSIPNIKVSSFFLNQPEGDSVANCQKELREKIGKLQKKVTSIMEDPDSESDIIYNIVNFLYKSSPLHNVIANDNEIVNRAWNRKILGNPPTSNKYTCCDEVIWESLLEYCNINECDLIIVSSDKTYKDNKHFLKQEFEEKTGHALIDIVDRISSAFQLSNIQPSKQLIEAETILDDTDSSNKLKNTGKYRYCYRCQNLTPHNGIMCTHCGGMDDDDF